MEMPLKLDKRTSPRVAVSLTAHCRIGTRYVRDFISDLSVSGLYLKTREPAREGTPIRVAVALPFEDGARFCTLVGSIARVDRDNRGILRGLGVTFDSAEIASDDKEAVSAFVLQAA